VAGEPRLRGDRDEVAQRGGARNAGLRDQDATAPGAHVVPDHHQVVEAGAGAEHRVALGAAVHTGVGADLHTVAEDDAAELRYGFEPPFGRGREAEALLADARARVQDDAAAEQGVGHAAVGVQAAAVADLDPGPHHGVRVDDAAAADARALADHGEGADLRPFPDRGAAPTTAVGWTPGRGAGGGWNRAATRAKPSWGASVSDGDGAGRHRGGEGRLDDHRPAPVARSASR
jgi:hypothetical protein